MEQIAADDTIDEVWTIRQRCQDIKPALQRQLLERTNELSRCDGIHHKDDCLEVWTAVSCAPIEAAEDGQLSPRS